MNPSVAFFYHDLCLAHHTGPGHPEAPVRMRAIHTYFRETGLLAELKQMMPEASDLETIGLVHTERYIQIAKRDIESGAGMLSTGDTNVSRESWQASLLAAGGATGAVDAMMKGDIRRAFCALRPPGHHATPNAGMGFCVFNSAAIAARYAQKKYGIGKVLIADWDIHHGNGTQDAFYEDGSVFYMSTHQDEIYPMILTGKGNAHETGTGKGKGANMNRPLPYGADDKDILEIFEKDSLPAAQKFRPELVIVSAGFDSREEDPLGGFFITDSGFRRLTRIVKEMAKENAEGRILSVLEGGYNPRGLALACEAHVEELIKP